MRTLHAVAEHEERRYCRSFGEAQQQLAEEKKRLDELMRYRREYRAGSIGQSGVRAVHWEERHNFLTRLDQAVAAQQAVVKESSARREAFRKRWLVRRQRVESLARVLERHVAEELQHAERREQRQQDALPLRPSPFDAED